MEMPAISSMKRWLLTGQALFAETAFWLTTMVLWVPMLVLTSVFYPATWTWASAVGLGFLSWWLSQPSIDIQGIKIQRADAPLLYKNLDDLAKDLDAPPIDEVVLDDSLNAGAYESRGFLSLIGVRRTLIIGLPLLRLLSTAEAKAVIAHELGHFSSRHGKLGHWIYLVRAKWMAYLYLADTGDSSIDSLRHALADRFLPGFIQRSAAWSRRCEFQADAVAASIPHGGGELVSALTKLAIINALSKTELARHMTALQIATPDAPNNYWDIVATFAANSTPSLVDASWVQSLESPSRPDDSHPPLFERAKALGCSVRPPKWDAQGTAGEELLEQEWAKQYEACNANWRARNRNAWRLQHLRLAAAHDSDESGLSPAQLNLRRLTRDDEVQLTAETLAALKDFERAQTEFPLASYSLGLALLSRGLPEGARFIRKAIRKDERLAIRGHETLLGFYYSHGTPSQIRQCHEQLRLASARVHVPYASIALHLLDTPLSSLDQTTVQLLRRALCEEKAIDGLWVIHAALPGFNDASHAACVAFVRMDPEVSAREPSKEESLVRDVTSCLESLSNPSDLVISTLWFTTEAVNPRLLARLQAIEDAEILPPTTPMRSDILKVDVA